MDRRFFNSLFLFVLLSSILTLPYPAHADAVTGDRSPQSGGIAVNPQTIYTFLGWEQLGRGLGLKDEWGIRVGGFLIPEFNEIASGGADPNSSHVSLAVGIHTSVDLETAFGIRGGTLGVEFLGFTGDPITHAAGCIQMLSNMDESPPRDRVEMMQAWWHQRLFEDKLTFHIGKMNAAGHFGTVTKPVIVTETHLQDRAKSAA